jgi:phage gpG-like protein
MAVVTTKAINVDKAMGKILTDFMKKNTKLVAKKVADMPRRFLREAFSFYPQVLRVRTGRLRKSFSMISQKKGDVFAVGLKSDVEYANIQHEGGKTAPHVIMPRNKKALFWKGANHPVKKVNHPGSRIRAKHFFSKPISTVAADVIRELKKEIGF